MLLARATIPQTEPDERSIPMSLQIVSKPPSVRAFGPHALLIYDKRLSRAAGGFADWASQFPAAWAVEGGERLKDARGFARAVERLADEAGSWPPRETTIVAAGGGSVGDFAGFLASVFKRGVGLVHVPTTWLSALDSAHGGKTALNVRGFKNQIGTFYPAKDAIACKPWLFAQPPERARDALGELAKIALIDGGAWTRALIVEAGREDEAIWQALPFAVRAKMKVVARDPFERKGDRQTLNLGHTLGHALESECGVPHGQAVAEGLCFAVEWSAQRGLLPRRRLLEIEEFLNDRIGLRDERRSRLSASRLKAALALDKKRAGKGATFVFLRGWGAPARAAVSFDEIVREARRQGRVR